MASSTTRESGTTSEVSRLAAVALALSFVAVSCGGPGGPVVAVVRVEPGVGTLQAALDGLAGPARVELAPGEHVVQPVPAVEPTCANCEEAQTRVDFTRGLLVTGRGVRIVGAGPVERVVVRTGAGYGVLFQDCEDCGLEGVTVTGGVRDEDPNASDAAVVVQRSTVTLRGCHLRDNVGNPGTVRRTTVGICGVAVREEGDVTVVGSRITRQSWDGVAVYRGGRATLRDNVIDGVDAARGQAVGGGRGVAIGVTWDGRAVVEGNLVRRYWKGIGVFVDADAEVRQNVVEDVLTWGIAVWDAGKGTPRAVVEGNVVHQAGACGIVVTLLDEPGPEGPGSLRRNVVTLSGQDASLDRPDRYCRQVAVDASDVPEGYVVEDNLLYANREAGGAPGGEDAGLEAFRQSLQPILEDLGDRPALAGSRFLASFG